MMRTHPESAIPGSWSHLHLWCLVLVFTGVSCLGAEAQTYLPSMPGPHPDLALMPDLQQPDTLIVLGGNPLPAPSWPNYCAPVSAANIWEFYDARDGINISPWMGDLPQPGPPFGWKLSWSTATIQGQGTIPGAPVQPLIPPVYMNTNGVGLLPPSWPGTRIQDIYQGVVAYAPAVETANALTKGAYQVSIRMDELMAWEPASPKVVTVTTEPVAYKRYTAAIDAGVPSILSFMSWVQPGTGIRVGAIEYYTFNGLLTGDTGGGVYEQWNGGETGHAVTGIGYQTQFDPDGDTGPLPTSNWYIVRDNWASTGVDVAVPMAGQWMATVYIETPKKTYRKWSQPPALDSTSPSPDCFWGWDEYSLYNGQWIVADDWRCDDQRPITDLHWWGSYIGWTSEVPPEIAPTSFQIGLWTDVPAGIDQEYSHPGRMIKEWRVLRTALNETPVGCDYYPERPNDICYRYDYLIPESEWFVQPGGPTIYWISIAAVYPDTGGVIIQYPWGWKTRENIFNDDAVRIISPSSPEPGVSFSQGEKIVGLQNISFDMSFEVTTTEPEPEPTPPPKFSQPPYINPQSDYPSCFWGWDEVSHEANPHLTADDWLCSDDRPVTDIHWWGSYQGWLGTEPPPDAPVSFVILVWTDIPAGGDQTFSHPGQMIWMWQVQMSALNERLVGCDYYPEHPKDSCFRYDYTIPLTEWFYQDPGAKIYWLTILAQYGPETIITHPWGWKTRPWIFQDAAVRVFDPLAINMGMNYVSGEPILTPSGDYFDMAFELTTNSWAPTPTPTGTETSTETPTLTFTETPIPTITDSPTWTPTYTPRPTLTSTMTNTDTEIPTPTWTLTPTFTGVPTPTFTPIPTDTPKPTLTPTDTSRPTLTPTLTGTDTAVPTPTWTMTPSFTGQATSTSTLTPTVTQTLTQTPTPTSTVRPTLTYTTTRTRTPTNTVRITPTATYTPTNTLVPTDTLTMTWTPTTVPSHTTSPTPTVTPTLKTFLKWSQPPVPGPIPEFFHGWDEPSVYNPGEVGGLIGAAQIMADDWLCSDNRPITDIHWWGSYIGWEGLEPPPTSVTGFHIGIWTDVPKSMTGLWSHPGILIWEWRVAREQLHERMVGRDSYPNKPTDTCFKYDFDIPREQWWSQPGEKTVLWISISAVYGPQTIDPFYSWGWKTRVDELPWNDDAVAIFLPVGPSIPGNVDFQQGEPLSGWDLAFEITTNEEAPTPTETKEPTLTSTPTMTETPTDTATLEPTSTATRVHPRKWAQPPVLGSDIEIQPPSPYPDCFWGWDELSAENLLIANGDPGQGITSTISVPYVADDWKCTDKRPVTDIHWWGSYKGWGEQQPPQIMPTLFHICIWTDVPVGGSVNWSHPGEVVWEWTVPITELKQHVVGCDYYTNQPKDACYAYDFQIPEDKWFYQAGDSTIYWLSIAAVYLQDIEPEYVWGWKTRPHINLDDAVRITAPPVPVMHGHFESGEPIYSPDGLSWDLAFVLTTNEEVPTPTETKEPTLTETPTATNSPTSTWTPEPTPTATEVQPRKWSQPPVLGDDAVVQPPSLHPECFWGWDEISAEDQPVVGSDLRYPYVADDWKCTDKRPITDIHWWGSYKGWNMAADPPTLPNHFHICIWTDVPAGSSGVGYSHPEKVVWEWRVSLTELKQYVAGCDYYTDQPLDTCFGYVFRIPQEQWFYQAGDSTIYWLSIAAVYPQDVVPEHVWGWKTRPHFFNDDAVRITAPAIPALNLVFESGEPIHSPDGVSWDLAFELTTNEEVPVPTVTPSPTDTLSPTDTPTLTPTDTERPTPTRTNTSTRTRTPTNTKEPSPTATDTSLPTRTYTNTNSPTLTRTHTPSPTSTATSTVTATPTRTHTPVPTPTWTNTTPPTPTLTLSHTPTSTRTHTRIPTPTWTNTVGPTPTFTPTREPTPTWTATKVPTPTWTNTVGPTPTFTPTREPTPTWTLTRIPTPTWTNTKVPTNTFTPTREPTPTWTGTTTPTVTRTNTQERTPTFTPTRIPTPTWTGTMSPTSTYTATRVPTPTWTNTRTLTPTPTYTGGPTPTATDTRQPTLTPTQTMRPTETPTTTATTTPTETPFVHTADLNGDGVVNAIDLIELLRQMNGMSPMFGEVADLNGDGKVDVIDLLLFLLAWH